MNSNWYAKDENRIFLELKSNRNGLSQNEAQSRLKVYGRNILPEPPLPSRLKVFLRQFQSPLIYVLLVASAIVIYLKDYTDAAVILAVLVVNAFIGLFQEGKAQNTLKALKTFIVTESRVLRDGKEKIIHDAELVPGDIILIREGDKIPADARLLSVSNFKVDESSLSGESFPVIKHTNSIRSVNLAASDQRNMIFKGTLAVSGQAEAIVTGTGVETVIGGISQTIMSIDSDLPLKTEIKNLSWIITVVIVVLSVTIFSGGVALGYSVKEMFLTAVAISVSVIPEGLPIAITLVLATGVYRMAKRNALVKKLQAVEALGQARIIAVDKTGTITKNELMVEKIYISGKYFDVTGSGFDPVGRFSSGGEILNPPLHRDLMLSGKIATFCADASVSYLEKEKRWKVSGDPTEAALLVLGQKMGYIKSDLEKEEPIIREIPFDSKTKFHGTVHKARSKMFFSVVGAPETIFANAQFFWSNGKKKTFLSEDKKVFEEAFHLMSKNGLRVLAFAMNHEVDENLQADNLPPLTLVGLFGMADVLREEVRESIAEAQNDGIKVVMITGDHKLTAEAIAKNAGIFKTGDVVYSDKDIDDLSPEKLSLKLDGISVFARITPLQKLRIIQAYKKRGDVVAMTGDGVNDAPSLVAADLGVAMGKIGTEVSKEAADIILLDDNFKSIVAAIEEGRSIYLTIKRVLLYLLSTGLGELLVIIFAIFLFLPLPILPSQIIWLNLVTDGILIAALAMEPKEALESMRYKRRSKLIIDGRMFERLIFLGIIMALGTLFLFGEVYESNPLKATTVAMTVLAVFQWFNIWNCRSEKKSAFANLFTNKYVIWATVISVFAHFLAVYNPFFQHFLKTTPLNWFDWVTIVLIAASILVAEELRKFVERWSHKKSVLKDKPIVFLNQG